MGRFFLGIPSSMGFGFFFIGAVAQGTVLISLGELGSSLIVPISDGLKVLHEMIFGI